MDHLFTHILNHKLAEFNEALAKDKAVEVQRNHPARRLHRDERSQVHRDLPRAKIISNDVRKILDWVSERGTPARTPSGITVTNMKVITLVEDLVKNVVLKYGL